MCMKKKYYFIVAAIIQIIASVFTIMQAKMIVEKALTSMEMFPEAIQERVTNLYQNSGEKYIIIISVVCILIDFIIIYFAYMDMLAKKKSAIIVLSIITLFTASYSIVELIAILNVIVISSVKKEMATEKKEIPKIEKEKIDKKKFILAACLLLFFFSQIIWGSFISTEIIGTTITIIFYLMMICFSIVVFKDKFREDFKLFRTNFKEYMNYILPKMAIFYIIFAVVSFIAISITKSTATNQSLLEEMPLLLSLPLAIIYAPIVEETLFRGCIRRFITNDKVFIIVSGIIFGLLHTVFAESDILNMIVLAIPYGVMGCFLAYIYVRTNNMFSNITCHALNNMVAMFFSILVTKL